MPEWWKALNPWIQSGIVVALAAIGYLLVRYFLIGRMEKLVQSTANDVDDRLVHFFRRFFGLLVLFLVLLAVLRIHEIEISPLLAGAGIAGIALALAAKELLADVLAGVFLITDRPMRVGNRVKIEYIGRDWGGWGDVVDIGLRRTAVRNTDGVIVNYPNHMLANSVITNFSAEQKPMRVRIRFLVGYDSDLDKARECATQAIEEIAGVIPKSTEIVTRSLWDDKGGHMLGGVLMEGRYRIDDIRERTRIRSKVLESLISRLRDASITLPALNVSAEKSG
ncbi:MAG: mechanosensitive ion channel family protein [Planctomycetota bacterium]|jgi:small-conductance mechanosensitive channel